jgi:hypothetical protein
LYLQSFGGCAVALRDLTDRGSVAWADALSRTTGLDRDALIAARDRRVATPTSGRTPSSSFSRMDLGDPEVDAVYDGLCALKDRHLPPSRQALRRFAA